MHLAPRAAVAAALVSFALAGCSTGSDSVVVAADVTATAQEQSAAEESALQMFSSEAAAAPAPEPTVTGVGFVDTEQHDVAFGTVVNADPRVAHVSVRVTTHDDKGTVLTSDVQEVRAAGATATPFVLDVFPPAGTTVVSVEAAHALTSVEEGTEPPSITVSGTAIHDDPINPVLTGRVVSSYPEERTAVTVTAVCVDEDGEHVAAGHGRVPAIAPGGAARFEIMLFGETPVSCEVAAA